MPDEYVGNARGLCFLALHAGSEYNVTYRCLHVILMRWPCASPVYRPNVIDGLSQASQQPEQCGTMLPGWSELRPKYCGLCIELHHPFLSTNPGKNDEASTCMRSSKVCLFGPLRSHSRHMSFGQFRRESKAPLASCYLAATLTHPWST